jgi:putative nucleotidyltransferase with HDIG domain
MVLITNSSTQGLPLPPEPMPFSQGLTWPQCRVPSIGDGFAIDWSGWLGQSWLSALADCPQDPEWHGEGDVLVHTKLVTEALVALPAWQNLGQFEQTAVFWAALLHDVAKPQVTVFEDGRWRAPKHAVLGAKRAQELLYHDCAGAGLWWRNMVVQLVRWHGLPLWFLERLQPERHIIELSQSIRLDVLAMLAQADVLGRVCPDQAELLSRVELFRQEAKALGCLSSPYRFANAASRYRYFHNPNAEPDYPVFIDPRTPTPEVIVLVGLPGTGKDTWIRRYASDWPVVSLDTLRQELGVDPSETPGEVLQLARERIRQHLRRGQGFVWNATNLSRSLRDPWLRLCRDYGAVLRIVYLEKPLAVVFAQNQGRSEAKRVPDTAIVDYLGRLDVPQPGEAHLVEWWLEW